MNKIDLDKLLLKTAFCCMSCDGDIDAHEIDFLKDFYAREYGNSSDLQNNINNLLTELNKDGQSYLLGFAGGLKQLNLSEEESLKIIEIALKMIYADNVIKYSEIKYFKIIRHNLNLLNQQIQDKFPNKHLFLNTSDEEIIETLPDIQYFLEDDIVTESLLDKITKQYLESTVLPQFAPLSIDKDSL